MSTIVYKILTVDEWAAFARSGQFEGSDHDQRDGFIHMCSGAQLSGTLVKHYAKLQEIVLTGFDESDLGKVLKWELSRGNERFPHLYANLPFSALVNMHRLAQTQQSGFNLPLDL